MCEAPVALAGMLDAQGLGAAVALFCIEDGFGGAGLSRPNRRPSLDSLLEIPVSEELFTRCAWLAGPRREAGPTAQAAQHQQSAIYGSRGHNGPGGSLADSLAEGKNLPSVSAIRFVWGGELGLSETAHSCAGVLRVIPKTKT